METDEYYFYLGPGNNAELIEKILKKITDDIIDEDHVIVKDGGINKGFLFLL